MDQLRLSIVKAVSISMDDIWRAWGPGSLIVFVLVLVVILIFVLVTAWRKRKTKYKPREQIDGDKVWMGDTLVPQGAPEWKE